MSAPGLAALGFDPARLVRDALGLPPREGTTAGPIPASPSLTIREQSLYRAVTRRRLRAATGLAGITLGGLAAFNALGLTLLFPERQAQVLATNGIEVAVGFGVAALALGRRRFPPLPLAFALACSMIVLGLLTLMLVPETRTQTFMLLAAIPPAVALFVPWSIAVHAGWLLAGGSALAAFAIVDRGAAVPAADWVGAWLVLTISGLASLIGCVGASGLRRTAFEHQMGARRALRDSVARQAELNRLNGELARAARVDPLTGLGNRLRLNDELAAASARTKRYGNACSLALLDLDRFKDYNDALGHVAGDAALRAVAAALTASVRATDVVCRFGGEEFVVLMPEQTLDGGTRAAERIRRAVEALGLEYPTPGGRRVLTISAGVAQIGRGTAPDADDVVRAADAALYRAKGAGRNRVEITPPSDGVHHR